MVDPGTIEQIVQGAVAAALPIIIKKIQEGLTDAATISQPNPDLQRLADAAVTASLRGPSRPDPAGGSADSAQAGNPAGAGVGA